MKLALYVHELQLEVGHSNSLIELIRHLGPEYLDQFDEIEAVTYTTAPLKNLFPNFKGTFRSTKVPFPKIKPSFLKSFFYHIWTEIYNHCFQSKDTYRIGIGVCCLSLHAVSVQFIHHQWTEKGLEMEKSHWLRKIYKQVLFKYYEACENYLFGKKNLKVFSPAQFLTDFLVSKYPGINAKTIYSGVNLKRFELAGKSKSEKLEALLPSYPALKGLDVNAPIYLFVGAYERKGIHEALNLLRDKPGAQFIIIGSPSLGVKIDWPPELKIFTITFTRQVPDFYFLADAFVFPTLYEPFGLVLFEAMAMGLVIITRYSQVGASELLESLPDVYFTDRKNFIFPEIEVMNLDQKIALRDKRLQMLGNVSWEKAGDELTEFLKF